MITQEENQECVGEFKQCLNHTHCGNFAGYSNRVDLGRYKVKHEELCFHCDHWEELVEAKDSNTIYYLRINGRHYQTHKNSLFRKPGKYNGFGGRQFIIHIHPSDTEPYPDGTMIRTHNLWTQGVIPEHYREKLYDNATFVNEVTETIAFDGDDFVTCFDIKPPEPECEPTLRWNNVYLKNS